jgi:glucose-6-phosphate dehydrogenase assembly protein OpcA
MAEALMEEIGIACVEDVAGVERQLAEFWRQAGSEEHAVVRVCSLNLVVACTDEQDAREATRIVAALSENHPGRVLVVTSAEEEDGPAMQAYVSAHCRRRAGGGLVCSEQILVQVRPGAEERIPPTLVQLLVEDLPVWTWWRRAPIRRDPLFAGLAAISDRFILDGAAMPDPVRVLVRLAELAGDPGWKGSVGDLAWVRLEPWRERIASMFDAELLRRYLGQMTSVQVSAGGPAASDGLTVAGAYLAGWLASRLDWELEPGGRRARRSDGRPVCLELRSDRDLPLGQVGDVRIEAYDADPPVAFRAGRPEPGSDLVRVEVEVSGSVLPPSSQPMPRYSECELLCGELERDARDPVFEKALTAASRIAGPIQDSEATA